HHRRRPGCRRHPRLPRRGPRLAGGGGPPPTPVPPARVAARGGPHRPGRPTAAVAWAGPPGTRVEVRNLFVNTPARREFPRTAQTELGHVKEAFVRLALSRPGVHLTLSHDGRLVYDVP